MFYVCVVWTLCSCHALLVQLLLCTLGRETLFPIKYFDLTTIFLAVAQWSTKGRIISSQCVANFCEKELFSQCFRETAPFHCLVNFDYIPRTMSDVFHYDWKTDPFPQNLYYSCPKRWQLQSLAVPSSEKVPFLIVFIPRHTKSGGVLCYTFWTVRVSVNPP